VTGNSTGRAWGGAFGYRLEGGGIFNEGTMALSSCTVTNNIAIGTSSNYQPFYSRGGGIFNDTSGHLTILSSVVQNNTAQDGADIYDLASMTTKKGGKGSHK
jgi:hypothetical protein